MRERERERGPWIPSPPHQRRAALCSLDLPPAHLARAARGHTQSHAPIPPSQSVRAGSRAYLLRHCLPLLPPTLLLRSAPLHA
jgi:hypothetical protein